jgi:hypothetical protein
MYPSARKAFLLESDLPQALCPGDDLSAWACWQTSYHSGFIRNPCSVSASSQFILIHAIDPATYSLSSLKWLRAVKAFELSIDFQFIGSTIPLIRARFCEPLADRGEGVRCGAKH